MFLNIEENKRLPFGEGTSVTNGPLWDSNNIFKRYFLPFFFFPSYLLSLSKYLQVFAEHLYWAKLHAKA